jgi:hypothetical protein
MFCVRCLEHENEIDKLRQENHLLKQKVSSLESTVEALSLDVAFYNGNVKLGESK